MKLCGFVCIYTIVKKREREREHMQRSDLCAGAIAMTKRGLNFYFIGVVIIILDVVITRFISYTSMQTT